MIFHTLPSQSVLEAESYRTPAAMRPSQVPHAVVVPGYFTTAECKMMVEATSQFQPYKHGGCNAYTREVGHISELDALRDLTANINKICFDYDLDAEPISWLQTYVELGDYPKHVDGAPGQTRKLTAVLLLSHEDSYDGGDLLLQIEPYAWVIQKVQGTVVIFPPWIRHEVTQVKWGTRKTINMGFYGPQFK